MTIAVYTNFQGTQHNYSVDVEFPGNFDFILEPDAVEDILESVDAASLADCFQRQLESEHRNVINSEIDCGNIIPSEETITFIRSDACYETQSIHKIEEIKGKLIQNYYQKSFHVPSKPQKCHR